VVELPRYSTVAGVPAIRNLRIAAFPWLAYRLRQQPADNVAPELGKEHPMGVKSKRMSGNGEEKKKSRTLTPYCAKAVTSRSLKSAALAPSWRLDPYSRHRLLRRPIEIRRRSSVLLRHVHSHTKLVTDNPRDDRGLCPYCPPTPPPTPENRMDSSGRRLWSADGARLVEVVPRENRASAHVGHGLQG